jgi:tetratricopeptide (TPR) repeat protein
VEITKTHKIIFKSAYTGSLILILLIFMYSTCLSGTASQSSAGVKIPHTSGITYPILLNAFEIGNYSYAASALESRKEKLNANEMTLLAKINWAMYYPYEETMALKTCNLMGEAVKMMPSGSDRDKLLTEYADMLNKTSRPEEAIRLIDKLTSSPVDELRFSAHILKTDSYNIQEKYNDAYAETVRIKRNFDLNNISIPLQARFHVVSGDTYSGLNEFSKALQMYNKALSLDKNINRYSPDIYLKTGIAFFKTGNPANAVLFLEKAVNLGIPSSRTGALILLGDCLKMLGRQNNAYALYYEASKIKSPGAVPAMLRMASILEERDIISNKMLTGKMYKQLTGIYKKALLDYPDSLPIVAYSMAKTNARYGNITQAFKMYYEAWAITGINDPVHAYSKSGAQGLLKNITVQYDGKWDSVLLNAYMSYKDGLLKDISDPQLMISLSYLLLKEGYIDDASEMAGRLINIESTEMKDRSIPLLVKIETRKGHLSKALKLINNYLENSKKGQDIPAMKTKKAELLMMLGKYKEALNYLENLESDGKDNLNLLRLKADLYRISDETDNEMRVYDNIILLKTTGSPVIERTLFIRACSLAETEPSRAYNLFSRLIREYPTSLYLPQAILFQSAITQDWGDSKITLLSEKVLPSGKETPIGIAARLLLNEINIEKSLSRYFKPETESVKNPALSWNAFYKGKLKMASSGSMQAWYGNCLLEIYG